MSDPNAMVTNDTKANTVLVSEKKSRFKVKNIIPEEDASKIEYLNTVSDNHVVQPMGFVDAAKKSVEEKSVPSSEGECAHIITKATLPGDLAPAPSKKSRFTVKSVPKDDDRDIESDIVPPSNAPTSLPSTANELQSTPKTNRAIDMQTQMMQKLEQLLLLNTQMLKTMMMNDKGKEKAASDTVTTVSALLPSLHDKLASSLSIAALAPSSSSEAVIINSSSIPAAGTYPAAAVEETSQPQHTHATSAHLHHSHSGQGTTTDPPSSISSHANNSLPSPTPAIPSTVGVMSVSSSAVAAAAASSVSLSSSSSSQGVGGEKDKSFAKLTHYLSEMKKELEAAAKQRRSQQLEMQRVSERCRQLEDSLTAEQTKNALLEERLEKAKANQKSLKQQLQDLQQAQKLMASSSSVAAPLPLSSELPVTSVAQTPAEASLAIPPASSASAPVPPAYLSTSSAGAQTTTTAVVVTSVAPPPPLGTLP